MFSTLAPSSACLVAWFSIMPINSLSNGLITVGPAMEATWHAATDRILLSAAGERLIILGVRS